MNKISKPTVYIEAKAWDKMLAYARLASKLLKAEISGMATVIRNIKNQWVISDPVILKQKCSSSNTHINKTALAQYLTSVAGKNLQAMKEKRLITLWWHSHHTMSAFMSSTDWDNIDASAKNGRSMALVINNNGERELIFSIQEPICHLECTLEVLSDYTFNLNSEIKKLVSEIETTKTIEAISTFPYRDTGFHQDGYPRNGFYTQEEEDAWYNDFASDFGYDANQLSINGLENNAKINKNRLLSGVEEKACKIIDKALKRLMTGKYTPHTVVQIIKAINLQYRERGVQFYEPTLGSVAEIQKARYILHPLT